MPAYGTPQAGYNAPPNAGLNLTSLIPGEQKTLISAADAAGANFKSVAIVRGPAPGALANQGTSFKIAGCALGTKIQIQVSDVDVDGDYYIVYTIAPDANGNGVYTDIGGLPFVRAVVTNFQAGDVPVVTASRNG